MMNEEVLARLMQKAVTQAFDDRGVATKADLEDIKSTLNRHEDKFTALEARLAALERSPPPPQRMARPSVGGRSIDSDTTASSGNEWAPRLIVVRGWAAWGCGPDDKLKKEEAKEVATRLLQLCPPDLAQSLQLLPPFALNHALSFKVCDGTDVRRRADDLQSVVARTCFKVRGQPVRAGPETSPERRRMYALFFSQMRSLEAACPGAGVWEACTRGMAFYRLPQWTLPGRVEKSTAEPSFRWNLQELDRLGLGVDNDNLPMRFGQPHEHQQQGQVQQQSSGKGGKGCSAPGRKRQATVPAEAAEAEAQAPAAATAAAPAPAEEAEEAERGSDTVMDQAVPDEDGEL